ncbi:MAG: 2OG-Fe(II) oxygenase [Candidatus Andeanibacterium colombiense]|uniref:2OG-Fe(II) oxygenase n=1 Tax=Candidatus Andeanibacterium colombiense TaxID=3121345 RepID=A0AAJ5X6R7_9SPHN|nr:MAG: 2OG-Fe(II) oxygenase [Sphingomonadaceae bacterium]
MILSAMTDTLPPRSAPNPDRAALARIGRRVRVRLKAHPTIYRVPTDKAELFALGDFMNPVECAAMIELIDRNAKPSEAFDTAYAGAYRTSYSGDVDPHDSFVRKIQRRIDDLLGIPGEYGETVQGQRYLPGQEFKQHFDWFDTERDYWQAEVTRGGQRSWTAMVFLNAVEAGGTTGFPLLQMSIEPRPGALLIWNNSDAAGDPNEWTLHAGMPVEAGSKYIITKWYRTRDWG